MKLCRRCATEKALTEFHNDKSKRDGKVSYCKECACAKTRDWAEANQDRKTKADAAYYRKNTAKIKEKSATWRVNNIDRFNGKRKEWGHSNPEKVREYKDNWVQRNPDKRSDSVKKYYSLNKDKHAAISAERRYRIRASNLSREFASQNRLVYKEARLVSEQTGVTHEVDHIFPLRGSNSSGLHVPWNLRIITMTENRSKGNSEPDEPRISFDWMISLSA